MKLLTVPQPRASLLAGGRIVFDTRPGPTDYRGPIAIHAASSLRTELGMAALEDPIRGELQKLGLNLATLPRGAVVAVAELVDCVQIVYNADGHVLPPSIMDAAVKEMGLGQWQPGLFAYRFDKVRAIGPIENVRGAHDPASVQLRLLDRIAEALSAEPV